MTLNSSPLTVSDRTLVTLYSKPLTTSHTLLYSSPLTASNTLPVTLYSKLLTDSDKETLVVRRKTVMM